MRRGFCPEVPFIFSIAHEILRWASPAGGIYAGLPFKATTDKPLSSASGKPVIWAQYVALSIFLKAIPVFRGH